MSLSIGSLRLALWCVVLTAYAGIQAFAVTPAQSINLPENGQVVIEDDRPPEVTARVARVTLLSGTAKVRHAGSEEWEAVVVNLPVVEGDEIVTDAESRLEIQFDKYKHLRLAGDSYLKVVGLKDEGIALSVPLGTMTVRITSFDKDKGFFEIDAPKTTIAIQDEGTYRVDSGRIGDTEVRVTVTNGGAARVYSDNAGFALRNGRSARIVTEGVNAGEFEMGDADRFFDEFDSWAAERDRMIAQRLKDAHYDRYYDNDIYGADDLNDHGEWIYTRNYGYVWRPYRSALSHWADWSPYRYGHWRWIPPYGWTWINDEPWGWATYHHGRWFFDDGFWYWSPYGYYRPARSWWYPALVVINVFDNNVCWYPLPYHYSYYSYNCRRGRCGGGHHGNWHNNSNNGNNNGPTPQTGGVKEIKTKVVTIPPSSVVAMSIDDFGGTKGIKKAPPSVANTVIVKSPGEIKAPELPDYSPVKAASTTIAVKAPKVVTIAGPLAVKTGAAPRKADLPMDNELRTTKIFNGRQPVLGDGGTGGTKPAVSGPGPVRQTGAVVRHDTPGDPPVKQAPTYTPPVKQPVRQPPVQNDSPPPVRQQPTYTPPVKAPVRQQPPASDPPVRSPVRSNPPVRSDPPPAPVKQAPPPKSEPVKQAPSPNRKVAGDGD
jgi:hypothetical protein